MILAPTPSSKRYLAKQLGRTALVCIDRPANGYETDAVLSDNADGMARAVEHLVDAGHRRIAYLGDDAEVFTQAERLSGFRSALARHHIPDDPALVYQHSPDRERIARHLRWLASMPAPPTAYVSANSLTTLEMIHAGFDAGMASFIGFDDFPLADVVCGGVSVIAQDAGALGTEATETLLRRIRQDAAPLKTTRMGTALVLRGRT